MGSRTAVCAWSILVSVTAGGCVLGNDNERPVLAVDPVWDESPTDKFARGNCDSAGVTFMTWEIQDSRRRTLEKSDKLDECQPLDFYGLMPGTYQLLLTGYDENEVERWNTRCTGLVLGRFDVLYDCRVDQVEPGDEGEGEGNESEDAGAGDGDGG